MTAKLGKAILLAVVLASALAGTIVATFNQEEGGGGPGGGGCNYCNLDWCGCSAAPLGWYLEFYCDCTGDRCYRECYYRRL
ncbi:MAG: hypothetical protein KA072_12285 [Thermoanaerobaculaceae bacterium]|nr:hypothetical protein [Thermoanaerobaculaceae bacterium]MDI9622265.1 hypothetical protein [Acidobacteriota bacterium]NLH11883.1 hypothetical protein [Holophagae bacterium]HPW56316.1 hypothetical protein [Thermoanaerobaculaceae bacterium]